MAELCFFALAYLYASVGHAGASGYLAAMALLAFPAAVMKPAALVMNIVVATLGTVTFARAGQLPWRSLVPFVLGSAPMAFLGGTLQLPAGLFHRLLGVVLWLAAARLLGHFPESETRREVPFGPALLWGAAIGFGAGLTGTGGGIFLTPLLLFAGWETPRRAAGMSAAFILINSISGLTGGWRGIAVLPPETFLWLAAVLAGGLLGARAGARSSGPRLRRLLAAVLVIAGAKLWLL